MRKRYIYTRLGEPAVDGETLLSDLAGTIGSGFITRLDPDSGPNPRLLIGRMLSRGFQPMGWVEVSDEGTVDFNATRMRSQFKAWSAWAEEQLAREGWGNDGHD